MNIRRKIRNLVVVFLCAMVMCCSWPTTVLTKSENAIDLRVASVTVKIKQDQTVKTMEDNINAALNKVGKDGVVTVTGENILSTHNLPALQLELNSQTVIWKAVYKKSVDKNKSLIEISSGSTNGKFVVDNGTLYNAYICVYDMSDSTTIEVKSSSIVESKTSYAIISKLEKVSGGKILVSGGTVQTGAPGTSPAAIYAYGGIVEVTGGLVKSTKTSKTINANSVYVTGGEVVGPAQAENMISMPAPAIDAIEKVMVSNTGKVTSTSASAIEGPREVVVEKGGVVSGGTAKHPGIFIDNEHSLTVNEGGTVESNITSGVAVGAFTDLTASTDKKHIVINGGVVRSTGSNGSAIKSYSNDGKLNFTNIEINGGVVESTNNGFAINVADDHTAVVINGGSVISDSTAIGSNGKVVTNGGQVTGTKGISTTADINRNQNILINGGTISASRVAIDAGSSTGMGANVIIDGTNTVIEAAGTNATAVQSSKKVTLLDGHIKSSGYALKVNFYGQADIRGGIIESTNDNAYSTIYSSDDKSKINITGGTVLAPNGNNAVAAIGTVTVSETDKKTLIQAVSGNAIKISGDTSKLNVTGGLIQNFNSTNPAIIMNGKSTPVISGGVVFSYGNKTTDIINRESFHPTDGGELIAWDTVDGKHKEYTANTDDELFMLPANTATWNTLDDKHGVAYENAKASGFVPLNVTVKKKQPSLTNFTHNIDDYIYDGTSHTFTVKGANGFTTANGGTIDIYYEGIDSTVYSKSLTPPKAAGDYQISITTSGGSAYEAIQTPLVIDSYTIKKRPLTLSGVKTLNKVYDGTNSVELTDGTLENVTVYDKGDVRVNLKRGSALDPNVGENKTVTTDVELIGPAKDNYSIVQPSNLTVNVTPKELSIIGVQTVDRAYDGTTDVKLIGGTLDGLVGKETFIVDLKKGTVSDPNVGANKKVTTDIQLTGNGLSNYTFKQPTDITVSITNKEITIQNVKATSRVYNGKTKVTLTGGELVGVDKADKDKLSFDLISGEIANANAGTNKSVTTNIELTGEAKDNYALLLPTDVTVNITPKDLTIVGVNTTNRVYDGTTSVELTGGTLVGLVGTETFDVELNSGSIADPNAGDNKSVTTNIQLRGAGLDNYTFRQPTDLTVNVTPKDLTIVGVKAVNRAYNGTTNVELTGGTLAGLVGTETFTVDLKEGSIANPNAGTSKKVTTKIELSGDGLSNYTFKQPTSIAVNISIKEITIQDVKAVNRPYDGTLSVELTDGKLVGVEKVDKDKLAFRLLKGRMKSPDVGENKEVTTDIRLTGNDEYNYILTYPTYVKVNITPREVIITDVEAVNRIYNGEKTVELTGGKLVGVVANDDLPFTLGNGIVESANVENNKVVTTNIELSGNQKDNYSLVQPTDVKVKISPKELTIADVTAVDRVYDGTNLVELMNGQLQGVVLKDEGLVGFDANQGTIEDASAGMNKAVSTKIVLTGSEKDNYTLLQPKDITVTILQAPIVGNHQEFHAIEEKTATYTYDIANLLPTLNKNQKLGNTQFSLGGLHDENQILSHVSITEDHKIAFTLADVVANNQATITLQVDSANFETFFVDLQVIVDKKATLVPMFTMEHSVYDGKSKKIGDLHFVDANGEIVELATSDYDVIYKYSHADSQKLSRANVIPKNAGSYKVTVTVNKNNHVYAGTTTKTFEIGQRELSIHAKDVQHIIGENMPTLSYEVKNLATTDKLENVLLTEPVLTHQAGDLSKAGVYEIAVTGGTVHENYKIKAYHGAVLSVFANKQDPSITPGANQTTNPKDTTLTKGVDTYDATHVGMHGGMLLVSMFVVVFMIKRRETS